VAHDPVWAGLFAPQTLAQPTISARVKTCYLGKKNHPAQTHGLVVEDFPAHLILCLAIAKGLRPASKWGIVKLL
jgi:hypothetical protein